MLNRKITRTLLDWKQKSDRKSLVISGARQIGKTYSVRAFAKEYYNSFVELNFIEHPEYKTIFEGSLDIDTLLLNLSLYVTGAKLIPEKTLILLDEVQECPQAVTSLKFWTQDKRYDVIATGSGLGMNYRQESSYPVGNVEYINMHSLDFEEFLWANGVSEDVIDKVRECFDKKVPVPHALHVKLLEYLQRYMVIGGMPEVVNTYIETYNLKNVDDVQRRLYRDYIVDIAHYAAPDIQIKAEKCYRSIPAQLTKENHKFQYSQVESKGTAPKFGNSLDWLVNAYMLMPVYNVKRIEYPLESYKEDNNFRMYPTDIGLLMAGFDFGLKKALIEDAAIEEKSTNIMLGTAKGGLYEALVADMLIKKNPDKLYFYKDTKSTMEIEFLIMNEDGVIPIEVKAGRKKANSLGQLLESGRCRYGYKLASQNVGVAGNKITLPLYMLMFGL